MASSKGCACAPSAPRHDVRLADSSTECDITLSNPSRNHTAGQNGLRKPVPEVVPDVPVPQDNGPQLTVRDVVVDLNLVGCNAGASVGEARVAP